MNRRELLAGLGALSIANRLALATEANKRATFFNDKGRVLGVQLYTVSTELRQDFSDTLSQIAQMGYRHVELAGFLGHSATEIADALHKAGLSASSAHIPVTSFSPDGGDTLQDMDQVVRDAKTLGLKYVILPILPVTFSREEVPGQDLRAKFVQALSSATKDDYLHCAQLLNEKGKLLAEQGIQMGYHNHNFEFSPIGDTTGFELLMKNTDPQHVVFEMDAGWVTAAGQDPIALLQRYPGRFRAMHVKDIKASTQQNFSLQQVPTEVGSGIIPWPKLLSAASKAGVTDFFVEQEPPFTDSPLVSIAKSGKYLSTLVL